MTIDTVPAVLAFTLAGAGAGWIYFSALWDSIWCLRDARRPIARYLGNLAVRALVISALLTLAAIAGVEHLAASFIGFVAARQVVLHTAR